MTVAFALVNDLRSLGRERLGLSCGLKGNGMCFSVEALRRVPYQAFSVVEDLEYGIQLAEAGMRVHYVAEECVRGEMVAGELASRSQRLRWEGGRRAMARSHGLRLLRRALSLRSPMLLDLSLELLVPPLAVVAGYAVMGSATSAVLVGAGRASAAGLVPWLLVWVFLCIYLVRGLQLAGLGLRGAATLAWAPIYLLWKMLLHLRTARQRPDEWVRTARAGDEPRRR